jgi:hypothetical protein
VANAAYAVHDCLQLGRAHSSSEEVCPDRPWEVKRPRHVFRWLSGAISTLCSTPASS